MFDWFKPKNKRNIVLPTESLGPVQGVELIRTFSTDDEPKVKDFPKEKYKVYWEIFLDAVPGGYEAIVKFYPFAGGAPTEHRLVMQSILELRQATTSLILSTMEKNRK